MIGVLKFMVVALMFAVMLRAVLSWFPPKGIVLKAQAASRKATDWLMRPMRRVIPPVGTRSFKLDLVPAIILVACQFVLLPVLS